MQIYITKTALKLVVAIIVFVVALFRTIANDFRFKFNCDVTRLNRHPMRNQTEQEYYHVRCNCGGDKRGSSCVDAVD